MLSSRPLRRVNNQTFGAVLAVLILALVTLGALGAPNAAHAEGSYLQYSAGLSIVPHQNITGFDSSGAGFSGRIESDPAYALGIAIGTNVHGQGKLKVRGEVAVDFRSAEVSSVGLGLGAPSQAQGDFNLLTTMVNGFIDYDLDIFVVPYVGIGVGYGRFEINAQNKGATVVGFTKVSDTDSVLAWNVMAGLTIPFTDTVDFTIGYRYVATTEPKYNSVVVLADPDGVGPLVGPGFVSRRVESEFDAHESMLGLKIKF